MAEEGDGDSPRSENESPEVAFRHRTDASESGKSLFISISLFYLMAKYYVI